MTTPVAEIISNAPIEGVLATWFDQVKTLPVSVLEPDTLSVIQELRDRASSLLPGFKFPTTRDEDWRFTNISPLSELNWKIGEIADVSEVPTLPEAAYKLVFVNGIYAPQLSSVENLPEGVVVGNLAQLPVTHRPRLSQHLAHLPGLEEDVFSALNTAGLSDAAVIWVEKNTQVEAPIHIVFISTGGETFNQPRCLVVAESNSQVSFVEEFVGEGVYFSNSVTEVFVAQNASVSHHRLQEDAKTAFHIGRTAIAQARDSRYTGNAISFGGQISRHNFVIFQQGEQTETTVNGLTMICGEQLADTHSNLALNYPYGTSRQLHKCIVGDRAHAVFNGKIFVPKPAQITDAGQLNRNLLLSPKARVDTKPQLEITADNVKCAHGATVSQLDDEEVFYLQSRGLNADDARDLLITAFALEVINEVPLESLQKRLASVVHQLRDHC